MTYDDILTTADGPVLTITIDRPEAGNKFRHRTCLELFDVLQRFRLDRELRAAVLTGAGDKFFCIGGEHDPGARVEGEAGRRSASRGRRLTDRFE